MERIYHIIRVAAATLIAGLSLPSCIYDNGNGPESGTETIGINAAMVTGGRRAPNPHADRSEESFMVLFWLQEQRAALELSPEIGNAWSAPYLAKEAPQPVSFYDESVYDTGYPYPFPEDRLLYATGYGPAGVITPGDNYRVLTVNIPEASKQQKVGHYDFLGCDAWCDIYRGSQADPFSQNKNKLFFRHLAAKLVFYVDRDEVSMENKQFVRNVQVKHLRMKIGDAEWTDNDCMYSPGEFTWSLLDPDNDFTKSYLTVIADKKQLRGNTHVTTDPAAGYKATVSMPFAGLNSDYVLQRNAIDRVPVDGMVLDSCYVCNPIVDGTVQTGTIQLKMDISADLSFDWDFPLADSESTTDGLTYTREWKDVTLNAIYEMETDADGNVQPTERTVTEFKPGNEYRVYITFSRTGVNLVAKELPWDYDGIHYVTIIGGDPQPPTTPEQTEQPTI